MLMCWQTLLCRLQTLFFPPWNQSRNNPSQFVFTFCSTTSKATRFHFWCRGTSSTVITTCACAASAWTILCFLASLAHRYPPSWAKHRGLSSNTILNLQFSSIKLFQKSLKNVSCSSFWASLLIYLNIVYLDEWICWCNHLGWMNLLMQFIMQ